MRALQAWVVTTLTCVALLTGLLLQVGGAMRSAPTKLFTPRSWHPRHLLTSSIYYLDASTDTLKVAQHCLPVHKMPVIAGMLDLHHFC